MGSERDRDSGFLGLGRDRLARFTYRAVRSLRAARDESRALGHGSIGAEHLLLGVIAMGEGVGAVALRNLGADPSAVRSAVLSTLQEVAGSSDRTADREDILGADAERVLELALSEASRLGHEHVGTEHILLGLLRDRGGIAEAVLRSFAIDLDEARGEVERVLAGWSPGTMRSDPACAVAPGA